MVQTFTGLSSRSYERKRHFPGVFQIFMNDLSVEVRDMSGEVRPVLNFCALRP